MRIAPLARRASVGLGLLLLLGTALAGGPPLDPPAAEGTMVEGYHRRSAPVSRLMAALDSGAVNLEPEEMVSLVHRSMAHGPSPQLRARDGWLPWLIGAAWPDARLTQDPRRLASLGVGLCSDAVIVLDELAGGSGVDCEMVDLRGHVVALLRRDGRRWTADPDYGLVFEGEPSVLVDLARSGELEEMLRAKGHGDRAVAAYLEVARTAATGQIVPEGVLNPRLARLEALLRILSWAIPLALIAWGLRISSSSASRRS